MNGIIEYDQKLTTVPRFLFIAKNSQKKNYWNIIFIFTLIYYVVVTFMLFIIWPPKTMDIFTISLYLVRLEFIVDVAVIFSTCFFLQQLDYRFQTLNDSWQYLLPEFISVPAGEIAHFITGMTLEKIRLLHAELSDLLRIFSAGYGQMLVGFFVFSYINTLLSFYFIIHYKNTEEVTFTYFLKTFIIYIGSLQNVIFILSIIMAASHVHEKVGNIMCTNI